MTTRKAISRLYCLRYGTQIVVIGNGAHKPKKSIRALQEVGKLKDANYFLRWLSTQITERIKDQDIRYYLDFEGNLEFNIDND